jgi:hypothetical protein
MTHAFYKRFPAVLLVLFIPVYVLNQYGDKIHWLMNQPALAFAIGVAKSVFSLCFLYFGIYAYICKVRPKTRLEGPASWIVFGSIFTLLSFGPPIFLWAMNHDDQIPALNQHKLNELTQSALDKNKAPDERAASAKLYYWETCRFIEYLDKDGRKQIYVPDKEDKQHIQNVIFLEKWTRFKKMSALGHIGLLLLSAAAFGLFIWYKRRTHSVYGNFDVSG